ncbi:hypothetical protein V501_09169, partial [Pseudogymnoascus sp. VKM F-4519 (FW-2642)]
STPNQPGPTPLICLPALGTALAFHGRWRAVDVHPVARVAHTVPLCAAGGAVDFAAQLRDVRTYHDVVVGEAHIVIRMHEEGMLLAEE